MHTGSMLWVAPRRVAGMVEWSYMGTRGFDRGWLGGIAGRGAAHLVKPAAQE